MSDTPRVDVGALGFALWSDAARALADATVFMIDWSEEDGFELNQKQKVQLVYATLQAGANLEAKFARTLIDEFEREGVDTWGLGSELATVLGRTDA
jgi:hypothetical protein